MTVKCRWGAKQQLGRAGQTWRQRQRLADSLRPLGQEASFSVAAGAPNQPPGGSDPRRPPARERGILGSL